MRVAAADSYIAYFGRYEVKQDRVTPYLETSLFPNWVGTDQERFYRFDGNRLTLRTTPMLLYGRIQSVYLIYARLPPPFYWYHYCLSRFDATPYSLKSS